MTKQLPESSPPLGEAAQALAEIFKKGPHPHHHQADSRHTSRYRFNKLKSLVLEKIEMKRFLLFCTYIQ